MTVWYNNDVTLSSCNIEYTYLMTASLDDCSACMKAGDCIDTIVITHLSRVIGYCVRQRQVGGHFDASVLRIDRPIERMRTDICRARRRARLMPATAVFVSLCIAGLWEITLFRLYNVGRCVFKVSSRSETGY